MRSSPAAAAPARAPDAGGAAPRSGRGWCRTEFDLSAADAEAFWTGGLDAWARFRALLEEGFCPWTSGSWCVRVDGGRVSWCGIDFFQLLARASAEAEVRAGVPAAAFFCAELDFLSERGAPTEVLLEKAFVHSPRWSVPGAPGGEAALDSLLVRAQRPTLQGFARYQSGLVDLLRRVPDGVRGSAEYWAVAPSEFRRHEMVLAILRGWSPLRAAWVSAVMRRARR